MEIILYPERAKRRCLYNCHITKTVMSVCVSITTFYINLDCLAPKHVLSIYYDNNFASYQMNKNRSASTFIVLKLKTTPACVYGVSFPCNILNIFPLQRRGTPACF